MHCRCTSTETNVLLSFFFFQAEDGIRDYKVTGVQTCALPICADQDARRRHRDGPRQGRRQSRDPDRHHGQRGPRSEEHTSELQSPCNLVCRLLLEKKKKKKKNNACTLKKK